jgi:alpha-D-xyloside xylohydrolase
MKASSILPVVLAFTIGCSDPVVADADADADADLDADADAGGDADADTDADTDADGELDGDAGPPLELGDGAGTTLLVERRGEVRLERGGRTLVRLEADAFVIGVVDALDPSLNYDPYYLEDVDSGIYRPPAGLELLAPEAATAVALGDAIGLDLRYAGGRASRVELRVSAAGRFEARWGVPAVSGDAGPTVFARVALHGGADEHFYGLGEHFDHVDQRGQVRAMQLEPAPLESSYNEAHVPIPLLVATGGWGVYVDSRRPGVFAVAAGGDDAVRFTYGLGEAAAEGLTFYLMAEDHPLDVTRHYYELTGFPGPVAPWALGPVLWRNEIEGQAAVEDDLRTLRELDLATTGYWIDRPYASAVNTFDFAAADYADPAAMAALADDLGLGLALWHTPYVDPDAEASRPLYDEAVARGYFAPLAATALASWGPPIDFTNPEAFTWWQGLLEGYRDLGVEGYKLDYAEEILVGAFGMRLPWRFHDGSDELTMHRGYQELYHRVYAEMLPARGGFLLCRAGVAGDQVNGVILWPGDIDADLVRQGDPIVDGDGETVSAVGGLAAAVIAGSSLGPSGFPLFGSDTGGYRHSPPDRETFIRWFEHTALSPVMQVGTGSSDMPWDLDGVLDAEVLDLYRTYARLHLRLFPYLWTYLDRLATDGRAIQQPLGLAAPELGEHPDDVYLLGDALLVAPVVDRGVTSRELVLPAGAWQDWWTGALHQGGVESSATVPAPLGVAPLLVRAWAPVPMLRPTIDALEPVADPSAIDSFATSPGPLWVRVAADPAASDIGAGAFVLYDGTALATRAAPAGDGACVDLELERTAGDVFGGATVFEVVGGAVVAVAYRLSATGADLPVTRAADQAAFDADPTAATWLDAGSGPRRAFARLPPDGAILTLRLCAE